MPRLRFTRDERGYENTFLVHTARRRGRERTRILYWFRSPPQVKVGRAAFDEEAIRALEETHPEIAFDWPAILEARPPEPETPEGDRFRRGRGSRPRQVRTGSGALPAKANGPPNEPAPESSDVQGRRVQETIEPVLAPEEAESPGAAEPSSDSSAYRPSAAEQALGPEGLSRLRARYSEVLARISNRVTDAAAADELRNLAEGLNPDAWVTASEVTAGLEGFERVLERIRQQLGQHRLDRRSRPRDQAEGAAPAAPSGDAPVPAASDEPVDPTES